MKIERIDRSSISAQDSTLIFSARRGERNRVGHHDLLDRLGGQLEGGPREHAVGGGAYTRAAPASRSTRAAAFRVPEVSIMSSTRIAALPHVADDVAGLGDVVLGSGATW